MSSIRNGDLYSNLIGEIELTMMIERNFGHLEFTTGRTWWWYNNDISEIRPTKDNVKPMPFLGNCNYILLATTMDGFVEQDDNVIKEYTEHGRSSNEQSNQG